jgi:hypothetical protein
LDWLSDQTNNQQQIGPWKRLQELKPYLSQSLEIDKLNDIKQFWDAVRFSGVEDLLAKIAESFAGAGGQTVNLSFIMQQADIMRDLVNVYRSLPLPNSSRQYLCTHHDQLLRRNLQFIQQRRIDIVLLDPVPELPFAKRRDLNPLL